MAISFPRYSISSDDWDTELKDLQETPNDASMLKPEVCSKEVNCSNFMHCSCVQKRDATFDSIGTPIALYLAPFGPRTEFCSTQCCHSRKLHVP